MKHLEFEDNFDRYPVDTANPSVMEGKSPINTLGELRKILKDLPDDTVIANGLIPMWEVGKMPDAMGERRAHRIVSVKKGLLKNGRQYICFLSGQDITDKVWKSNGLKLEGNYDTGSGN